MQERNISFLDPFNLTEKLPEAAARDLQLACAGTRTSNGKTLQVIERCILQDSGLPTLFARKTQWQIDVQTGLVTELADDYASAVLRTRYLYDKINEPLPPSLFSPPIEPGLTPSPLALLGEGFTTRFINLRDGADGEMSLRWGKQGPKKRNSSGLN
jgi:hypothetical protein